MLRNEKLMRDELIQRINISVSLKNFGKYNEEFALQLIK